MLLFPNESGYIGEKEQIILLENVGVYVSAILKASEVINT